MSMYGSGAGDRCNGEISDRIEDGTEGVDETAERSPSETTRASLTRLAGADGTRASCWTLDGNGRSEDGQSGGDCTVGGVSASGMAA